ncbi:copper resistance protein B [Sphingomonas sp. MAH-20]|jgi:copper resistance protein B|uniref:Copper resistance protein B n=1 Tax=Sphingomonas horti TaxID=2682842 RepID=A0A6I4IYQ1_9SPHN|nr:MULTISPECIES: copper resistance protein B [Sphingomonas]MBA2918052.1 copper resistance protein B [Sphingomonas sp. CGMCC 1.13658]MVO77023.1 copper resistance protein B [Sphingomonas horti]
MRLVQALAGIALSVAMPAAAQDHSMHGQHGGHDTPAATQDHSMHGQHGGHDMPAAPVPAAEAKAPPVPTDHYADRFFPIAEMGRARHAMMKEMGGRSFYQVMFNLAEYQARKGSDGYRWDGEAWFGGDIDRLTLKTEGEATARDGVDSAEVQALYSRAIGPYFNIQAGIRHDIQPGPARTYATVGVEGLAPYWLEVEGALFLSDKGDLLARVEGYYDQRITERLMLQPRVELNLAAQDVPANRIGAGLSNAELGLRLRYEIAREFAPYVGVSYERKLGHTARFARAAGDDVSETGLVLGVRFWF